MLGYSIAELVDLRHTCLYCKPECRSPQVILMKDNRTPIRLQKIAGGGFEPPSAGYEPAKEPLLYPALPPDEIESPFPDYETGVLPLNYDGSQGISPEYYLDILSAIVDATYASGLHSQS